MDQNETCVRRTTSEAPFADIEAIYQMAGGDRRVMVLIELMSKQVRVPVAPASLRKVGCSFLKATPS